MNHPVSPVTARESLRRLATPHALAFGSRLLHRGSGGVLTFREFLAVARELVTQLPEQTAIYLAVLVALDMGSDDDQRSQPPAPSVN